MPLDKIESEGRRSAADLAGMLKKSMDDLGTTERYSLSLTLKGTLTDYPEYVGDKVRPVKVESVISLDSTGRWLQDFLRGFSDTLVRLDVNLDYRFTIIHHPEDPVI
jgi:hypothetical protein